MNLIIVKNDMELEAVPEMKGGTPIARINERKGADNPTL